MEASLQKRNEVKEALQLAIVEIRQALPAVAIETANAYRELEIVDEETYDAAKKAVRKINAFLKQIEDARKEKKEEALRYGQAIDSTARDLRGPLEEVKEVLTSRIKEVDNQKLRDADHEAAIEEYAAHLEHLELKRRADEAEARERALREEQERKEREAHIAREAEERARQKAEAEIQAAKSAQEKAEREAKEAAQRERERIQREQAEKERKERLEKEAEERRKQLAPDLEKVGDYFEALGSVKVPDLTDEIMQTRMQVFQAGLRELMENF